LIVGVIPALKATGPRVQERLKHTTGGSAAGLRFGGVWTGVIVLQVGITVVFLAVVTTLFWGLIFQNAGERALTIPADRYVVARLNTDRDIAPEASNTEADAQYRRRLRMFADRFAERLAAEPGVLGSGFGSRLPGMNHIETAIEVDGGDALPGDRGVFVRTAAISPGLLPALQARLVEGRAFTEADAAPGRHVAIVDQTFVRTVLGGGPAVGRQFRSTVRTQAEASGRGYVHTPESADARGPWTEIVGVIEDLTDSRFKQTNDAVFYQPAYADATLPLYAAVHVAGDSAAMMWRLRVIAAEIDPALRLDEMLRMDQLHAADRVALSFFLRLLTGIGMVALVLATAGVYALMSFTVARRTTEIGIRLALGADSRRIVFTTFARALAQVGAGVAIGVVPAAAIAAGLGPELAVSSSPATAVWICAVAAGGTILVTALACVGPARRVLRIQPIDTLKAT
jgi:hypothetical protein